MHQIDLKGDPKVEIPMSQCRFCKAKRKHYVPQPNDVPEELRDLTEEAIHALKPLDVDV